MMKRVASIDILRSLTMLLMLWVNDFAHMDGIPAWMLHAPTKVDMLGLSDLAFPSFLFCMGLSVPYALESRIAKGEGTVRTLGHILVRSLSLILLGLMELNGGGNWYSLVLGLAIFFIWNDYPRTCNKWLRIALTGLGLGAIACLARSVWPMHTGWWGILGLIGWSYLLCAVLYLLFRKVRFAIPVIWALVIAMLIMRDSGLRFVPSYPGGWVHAGLAFTGVLCSTVSRHLSEKGRSASFPVWAFGGAVLMTAGFLACHKFWIISKNMGTPTWMFVSLAIDLALTAVLFYVADVRGHSSWARPIRAAGVATFTCYCLPLVINPLMDLLCLRLPDTVRSGCTGLLLAFIFALFVIFIADMLSRIHIRLKL